MDVLTRSGLHHATGNQIPPPSHARGDRLPLRRLAGVLARRLGQKPPVLFGHAGEDQASSYATTASNFLIIRPGHYLLSPAIIWPGFLRSGCEEKFERPARDDRRPRYLLRLSELELLDRERRATELDKKKTLVTQPHAWGLCNFGRELP
jgi:hypothetical protein